MRFAPTDSTRATVEGALKSGPKGAAVGRAGVLDKT
jgi:hypothetical protein